MVLLSSGCGKREQEAEEIISRSGIQGGLIVHAGCRDGKLTSALHASDHMVVHGLAKDPGAVRKARNYIDRLGLTGKVSVESWDGLELPCIDHMVNLLVCETSCDIPEDEMMRVLVPGGTAMVRGNGQWEMHKREKLQGTDEWPQYLYDGTNNAVSKDVVVNTPRGLQWTADPYWARHHDRMASMSALVSSGGRVFYIMDEGLTSSIMMPSDWSLICRDAFNGALLWKVPVEKWVHHLWPLKSGPAQLPRRLAADGDRLFVTLSIDGPVSMLDAATGEVLHTFENTTGTEEILLSGDIMFAQVNDHLNDSVYRKPGYVMNRYREKFWEGEKRRIVAMDPGKNEVLWESESSIMPITLTADRSGVYFHDGQSIICLNRDNGEQVWKSRPVSRAPDIMSFFAPVLLVHDDVVLFAGGERAGQQMGEWYAGGEDYMQAFSAQTGEKLWTAYHPPSGYRSPEDLFVINGLAWAGNINSGIASGKFTGRDIHTGKTVREFLPDIDVHWFHHRCYRNKATENFIIAGRTGIEYIDPLKEHWDINHWVRGGCLYGTMPANGLTYAPSHDCACFPEGKLNGFNALNSTSRFPESFRPENRKPVRGPAYGHPLKPETDPDETGDWPTYRHDPARSGRATTELSPALAPEWETGLGTTPSSVVISGSRLYVAGINAHTMSVFNASTGKQLWRFIAGGRIDSPPTVYRGRVLFGSADGWVYCLRETDGELIWKFQAAPGNTKTMARGQMESLWPVHGNIMVENGIAVFAAGRSAFLDGGLLVYRLDVGTGEPLSVTRINENNPETGNNLQQDVTWLTMPVALPDIFSTDGNYMYMRSQKFDMEGKRIDVDPLTNESFEELIHRDLGFDLSNTFDDMLVLQTTFKNYYKLFLEKTHPGGQGDHLFCPGGFLDDTWFHRSYWVYGKYFTGGWNGYYLAGQFMPAGRIMVFDQDNVYGFGRLPRYYRWTLPLEYQLFGSPKQPDVDSTRHYNDQGELMIEPDVSAGFNWSTQIPLFVRAMVLSGDKLYIAGPADVVDEEEALRRPGDPGMLAKLEEQNEILRGGKGGLLWVVSARDGKVLARYKLESPPVWDGMAAADNKLYMSTVNGKILCFGQSK